MTKEEFVDSIKYLKTLKISKGEVAKALGLHPGYLSDIINGRKKLTQSVINDFQKSFPREPEDGSLFTLKDEKGEYSVKPTRNSRPVVDFKQKYYNSLEEDKEFLKELLRSSLITIAASQLDANAHLKAILDHEAEKEAAGNPKKKKEAQLRLSKLVDGHREALKQTGNYAPVSKLNKA